MKEYRLIATFLLTTLIFIIVWQNWALIPTEYIRDVSNHLSEWMGAWKQTESVQEHLEALNLLISVLAFIGLLITIVYQHQDLQATKNELKTTNNEFARQTLESTLFQYYQQMKSVAPAGSARLCSRIIREAKTFDGLCRQMKRRPRLLKSRRHLNRLKVSVNEIRKLLKEFSTMRRIFASWSEWVHAQEHLGKTPEQQEKLVKIYIHRLWCMFDQTHRRILFLQNAFYLEGRKQEWFMHYELVKETKCINKFVKAFNKKAINLLLLMLHVDGNAPSYPISNKNFSQCISDVYEHGIIPYTFSSNLPAPSPGRVKYYMELIKEKFKHEYMIGLITGSVITAAIIMLF